MKNAGPLPRSVLAKRVARLNAVQALFQMEASGQALDGAKSEFIERKFGPQLYEVEIHAPDNKFFQMLVETAVGKPVANRSNDEPRPFSQVAARLYRPHFARAFQIGGR